ncbi:MAG: N-acetylmuramoyl-L-alanine amidase [Marvinbryantia sp.]|jgi:N-acetylmuramoyl-L-alanine amidase
MKRNRRILEVFMTVLIFSASFLVGRLGASIMTAGKAQADNVRIPTIVLDAGHGGIDGGKIGINGEVEKEINLLIAGRLKNLLEQQGIAVVMTRTDDNGLYEENATNKKQQDMKRRCELINQTEAELVVSIHQNSYTEPSVCGPQVFYYENSAAAKEIAAILQSSLNTLLEIERPREIKANDSYYILRKTERPAVIVECGFLSNPAEAALLSTEEYQQKVAEAICAGILQWMEETSS